METWDIIDHRGREVQPCLLGKTTEALRESGRFVQDRPAPGAVDSQHVFLPSTQSQGKCHRWVGLLWGHSCRNQMQGRQADSGVCGSGGLLLFEMPGLLSRVVEPEPDHTETAASLTCPKIMEKTSARVIFLTSV